MHQLFHSSDQFLFIGLMIVTILLQICILVAIEGDLYFFPSKQTRLFICQSHFADGCNFLCCLFIPEKKQLEKIFKACFHL